MSLGKNTIDMCKRLRQPLLSLTGNHDRKTIPLTSMRTQLGEKQTKRKNYRHNFRVVCFVLT